MFLCLCGNQGPVAAGGLGGPSPGSEGQREAVITQENTSSGSPPHSPTSTHSEASLPGLSQECDTASTGDDTSSTPCVTCVSSSLSEAPRPQDSTGQHESLGNSDSEYESAEELDSPIRNSPQSEEAPQASNTTVPLQTEECFEEKSFYAPLSNSQTDTDPSHPSAVNINVSDRTESGTGVASVNSVEIDTAIEFTPAVNPDTTAETTTEAITDATPIKGAESEQPVSTVCESVVTVTKNEVIEESVIENTVLVEQQVIATTYPTQSHSSPEPDKPVDVGEINLDVVTSGDTDYTGSCLTCAPVDVSEAKEAGDQAAPSGEGENPLESQSDGKVTEEPIVLEATNKPEHTPLSSEEVDTPTLHQGTEHSVEEKAGQTKEAADTPQTLIPEQCTTPEDASTTSATVSEQKEESPPPLPPPDPDDIPILPKQGYNLDFLDNLDNPNFNPFASKTTIRNTPPPSPEPGQKLPPLKPAIKKKSKKTPEAVTHNSTGLDSEVVEQKVVEPQVEANTENSLSSVVNKSPSPSQDANKISEPQHEATEENTKSPVLDLSLEDGDSPARVPVKPLRKPLGKTPLKPKVTENNNGLVEETVSQTPKEDRDLPITPSKGYNLDFLDDLDPNFNPFSSKSSVRNSPPSSGVAFPASQHSQEKAGEQEAKVVVAKKSSPKRGFAAPRKNSEVKNKPLEASEVPFDKVNEKQETLETSPTKKPEPSPSEEKQEEGEEELPVPKKGYSLDFLDDPNFDPFQSRSSLDKADSGAKSTGVKDVSEAVSSVIANNRNNSAKVVESKDKPKPAENKTEFAGEDSSVESKQPEVLSELASESEKEVDVDSAIEQESPEAETEGQDCTDPPSEFTEDSLNPEFADKPKDQTIDTQENYITKDGNQTTNQNLGPPALDSEDNWDTENTEPHLGRFRTPSIGTIGQLDSLEFDQLLEHEASRIAEEFMNCSRDSGLPDYDESPDSHHSNLAMADTSYTNIRHVDENVNPFQRSSRLANSPPLGKRGAVCGAESTESHGPIFGTRRSLKRDIVLGEERLDTSSLEDDSGIVLGSRSDLETEVNHSEAGPEIATGLTSNDLKCASQFFREATDLENHMRRNLMSPLLGSHSKLSGDEVTPTKDKKEPPAGAPDSPQNKPTSSTSSPAPPPREERSAPEGTSSPSPRPSDTAERKSLSARPTSAPPEGYMTASEVQELLKRQELKFEEKLLRVELAAGEKEKKLQQTMKDEQKDLQTLGSSVTELTQSRDALLKMVGQYKGMLASLVAEKEKEKKASEEKISSLQVERDQALEDLANVEVAFSDVHRKYERTKQVVDTLKRNEETLRGAVADYEAKLKKQEQKFLEFQKHAEEKIQMANEEFESMRKSNEQEMTKMAALLKKAEMKIMSLQDSFDRKTRENQELTQLCDDLINKVGTSH